jgi:hypothetical protein
MRFELWNTDLAPRNASSSLSSAPFGPATGGATCTLYYAVSEVQSYPVPPFRAKVAWSESGYVQEDVTEDVATRTGYDVGAGGAWIWLTVDVALPAEADGQDLTVSFEAYATNMSPGLALAMLVDNVSLDCE